RQAVPVLRNWLLVAPTRPVLAAAYAIGPAHKNGSASDHGGGTLQAHVHDPHAEALLPRTHSHGEASHTHALPKDTPLTWRSLFALGLFGGLVPSINALIILLATLSTGRAAYGLVLVLAFGVGLAVVLGGTGLG